MNAQEVVIQADLQTGGDLHKGRGEAQRGRGLQVLREGR